jgi:hypothetical protein
MYIPNQYKFVMYLHDYALLPFDDKLVADTNFKKNSFTETEKIGY